MNDTRSIWTAALVALLWPLSAQATWYASERWLAARDRTNTGRYRGS